MFVVPVIDLLHGAVVRAIAGRRDEYKAIDLQEMTLVEFARSMIAKSRSDAIYIADLDAVLARGSQQKIWVELADILAVDCFVDAGLRTPEDVLAFPDHPRLIPVLGTETMAGPETALAARERGEACAISIDLRDGRLLGPYQAWQAYGVRTDTDIAAITHATTTLSDAGTLILLDLAGVGMNRGPLAEIHIATVRQAMRWREGELWIGGGIRHQADLERLAAAGVNAVLSSSALLDGKLN